jgi:hypothetical protein
VIEVLNPNGLGPFVPVNELVGFFSSCNSAKLHNAYTRVVRKLDF